jgi:hypothetical protein
MPLRTTVHSHEEGLDVLKAVLVILEKEDLVLNEAYHQLKVHE